jgi:hypothetical protein
MWGDVGHRFANVGILYLALKTVHKAHFRSAIKATHRCKKIEHTRRKNSRGKESVQDLAGMFPLATLQKVLIIAVASSTVRRTVPRWPKSL